MAVIVTLPFTFVQDILWISCETNNKTPAKCMVIYHWVILVLSNGYFVRCNPIPFSHLWVRSTGSTYPIMTICWSWICAESTLPCPCTESTVNETPIAWPQPSPLCTSVFPYLYPYCFLLFPLCTPTPWELSPFKASMPIWSLSGISSLGVDMHGEHVDQFDWDDEGGYSYP